jgi:hypothetical protein
LSVVKASYAITGRSVELTAPMTLSFVTSSSGTGTSKGIPSSGGVAAGDVAIIYDSAFNNSGSPSVVTPSGWTMVGSFSGANSRISIYAKKLVSGDIGGSITGLVGDFVSRWATVVLRPSRSFSAFGGGGSQGTLTSANPAASVSPVTDATSMPVLVLAQLVGSAAFTETLSPAMTGVTTSVASHKAFYKIYNSGTLVDQSVDMGDTGNVNGQQVAYLTFTP